MTALRAQKCAWPTDDLVDPKSSTVQFHQFGQVTNERFSRQLVEVIPALLAFARSLCRRADLAEDLTQEALTKAWAARDTYSPNSNFQGWIFTILRHHYYSWCQRQRWSAPWDHDAAERLLVGEPEQIGHIELAELVCALQALPPPQYDALILVGAGGYSYEEAAQLTGCALGTLKSRVTRGRAALQIIFTTQTKRPGGPFLTGMKASASILEDLQRLACRVH
jgi:RNA polymerase sigma-70 factor, ECF subfamily